MAWLPMLHLSQDLITIRKYIVIPALFIHKFVTDSLAVNVMASYPKINQWKSLMHWWSRPSQADDYDNEMQLSVFLF